MFRISHLAYTQIPRSTDPRLQACRNGVGHATLHGQVLTRANCESSLSMHTRWRGTMLSTPHAEPIPLHPLYRSSEQSRWAPQLGQRSWQACMSIIACPHMGHSFLLSAGIHDTPGSASYYLFWQDGAGGSCHPTHACACSKIATCLSGSQTYAVATTPSSGTKICTN